MGETQADDGTPKSSGAGDGRKSPERSEAKLIGPRLKDDASNTSTETDEEEEEEKSRVTVNSDMEIDPVNGKRKRKRVAATPTPDQPEKVYQGFTPEHLRIVTGADLAGMKRYLEGEARERAEFEPPKGGAA